MFAAGYDIRTRVAFAKTMEEFDKVVGFQYLKGMHINGTDNIVKFFKFSRSDLQLTSLLR